MVIFYRARKGDRRRERWWEKIFPRRIKESFFASFPPIDGGLIKGEKEDWYYTRGVSKGAIAATIYLLSSVLFCWLDIFLLLRYVTFPLGQLRWPSDGLWFDHEIMKERVVITRPTYLLRDNRGDKFFFLHTWYHTDRSSHPYVFGYNTPVQNKLWCNKP